MGRPLSENPKKSTVACRLNKDEMVILEKCCEVLKMDKSSVLRQGLFLTYDSIKEKK